MFFDLEIPRTSEVTVKIRFVTGRGQPFIAWQGPADTNEAKVLEDICQSPIVCAYLRKSMQTKRIKPEDDGGFRIPVKIAWFALNQKLDEQDTELTIYPLWNGSPEEGRGDHFVALDVIRTLVESMQDKHQHLNHLLDTTQRMQESYEKAVAAISQHSLQAMDKVSGHASSAFSSAATPFAEMGKSIVKALDDSRSHSATTAKESQDLLIEALKNRIIESSQVNKQSVTQDIKEVLQLWPMFKGLLGEVETKPQT